jgi:hypothetical protein
MSAMHLSRGVIAINCSVVENLKTVSGFLRMNGFVQIKC